MCIYIDRCDQFDQRIYEREELDLKERGVHFLEFLYHFGERILMHRRRHVALRSLVVFTWGYRSPSNLFIIKFL